MQVSWLLRRIGRPVHNDSLVVSSVEIFAVGAEQKVQWELVIDTISALATLCWVSCPLFVMFDEDWHEGVSCRVVLYGPNSLSNFGFGVDIGLKFHTEFLLVRFLITFP